MALFSLSCIVYVNSKSIESSLLLDLLLYGFFSYSISYLIPKFILLTTLLFGVIIYFSYFFVKLPPPTGTFFFLGGLIFYVFWKSNSKVLVFRPSLGVSIFGVSIIWNILKSVEQLLLVLDPLCRWCFSKIIYILGDFLMCSLGLDLKESSSIFMVEVLEGALNSNWFWWRTSRRRCNLATSFKGSKLRDILIK